MADTDSGSRFPAAASAAATIAALAAASFLPEYRVWGIGFWAFLPVGVRVGLAVAAVIVLAAILSLRDAADRAKGQQSSQSSYFLISTAVIAVFGALYFLFPARSFFLGDGLQNLDALASGKGIIKATALGEGYAHVWLAKVLGVSDRSGALLVFRLLSGLSGIVFVAAAVVGSRRLFDGARDQFLFVLGLATGGYALLWFGYVEQYSLFVAVVGIFTLIGLLVAHGAVNRFWLLPLLALAVLMHIFGLLLLPAALYLLLADTSLGRRIGRTRNASLVLAGMLALIAAVSGGIFAFRSSLFLRYALIPLADSIYAYDSYTLLSWAHLLDFVNLALLLLPGAGLLVLLMTRRQTRAALKDRRFIFLTIMLVIVWAGLFLVDPKLGLPRDWDLFSFAGLPLVALFYLLALRKSTHYGHTVALMGIVLSAFVLATRVAILRSPDDAREQHRAYLALDPERGLRAYSLIRTDYLERGDTAAAETSFTQWNRLYPERAAFFRAVDLKRVGKWPNAVRELRLAVGLNPTYADAWSHLGECYIHMKLDDSAYVCLHRALRLNPYEASAWNNLGNACIRERRYDEAETALLKAHDLLGDHPANQYNIATVYRLTGRTDLYLQWLEKAAQWPNTPPGLYRELADVYLAQGNIPAAAAQFRIGLARGLDTASVRAAEERYPALKQALRPE